MRMIVSALCAIGICAAAALSPAQAQQQWADIDCASSKITLPNAIECQQGPPVVSNNCSFEQFSAYAGANTPRVFAKLLQVTDLSRCWIDKSNDIEDTMRGISYTTMGNATDWSKPRIFLAGQVSSFDTLYHDHREECAGFIQYGHAHLGGFDYTVRGFVCAAPRHHLSDADIETAIKSVQLR